MALPTHAEFSCLATFTSKSNAATHAHSTFEGSRLRLKHFRTWTLELSGKDWAAREELQNAFKKATAKQWRPRKELTAGIMKNLESKTEIPASEIASIDLETGRGAVKEGVSSRLH